MEQQSISVGCSTSTAIPLGLAAAPGCAGWPWAAQEPLSVFLAPGRAAGWDSMVSDHMWYPGPEGQKGQIHSESSGITDAVLLSSQTVVVGQILCRQRLLLILMQTPFPAGCPAQSWLSLKHQGSTCRAEGDAGSGYPTGAASTRPGRWRSVSFEDRAITRRKSRKQRVDDVTIPTSQKVMQGLPQLYQEAGMWQ